MLGKLLPILCEDCELVVFGTNKSDELILNVTNDASKLPLLLYPSKNSVPLSQIKYANNVQPLLFVIDSTWSQAKSINRNLPNSIKRVHIDDLVIGDSLFLLRKQKVSSKVSSIESVALALEALGTEMNVVARTTNALKLLVDAVLRQRGRKNVYGNVCDPIMDSDERNGPFTKAVIAKPSAGCPSCGQKTARFKNLGIANKFYVGKHKTLLQVGDKNDSVLEVDSKLMTAAENSAGVRREPHPYAKSDGEVKSFHLNENPLLLSSKNSELRNWKCKVCNHFFSTKLIESPDQSPIITKEFGSSVA